MEAVNNMAQQLTEGLFTLVLLAGGIMVAGAVILLVVTLLRGEFRRQNGHVRSVRTRPMARRVKR